MLSSKDRVKKALQKAEKLLELNRDALKDELVSKAADYISDAEHFLNNGDLLSAIAAADYAYGLIEGALHLDISIVKGGVKSGEEIATLSLEAMGLDVEASLNEDILKDRKILSIYWKKGRLIIEVE